MKYPNHFLRESGPPQNVSVEQRFLILSKIKLKNIETPQTFLV